MCGVVMVGVDWYVKVKKFVESFCVNLGKDGGSVESFVGFGEFCKVIVIVVGVMEFLGMMEEV